MPNPTVVRRTATDYAVVPGETLAEFLEDRGMSQAELARRTARPLKTINEIIKGKASITPETAIQLERVLGVTASFWNSLDANYREDLARLQERLRLERNVGWLDLFPIREMLGRGLLRERHDKPTQVAELLNFFGVSSPEAWNRQWAVTTPQFRQSTAFQVSETALAVWLRWGEVDGADIHCERFDEKRFETSLAKARRLTRETPDVFVPALQRCCAAAGAAVVFTPELPKTRVSGATRWLSPDKALIQLSLRYKRDDALWFSFFHEAGHVLLHGRRRALVETDQGRGSATPQEEADADRFASDMLIPPRDYDRLARLDTFEAVTIERFAEEIGVAPGIVVGRLQHDGLLPWNSSSGRLRRRLRWSDEGSS
jgi:HTH-type transcriptional regulator/antitoxin HigA